METFLAAYLSLWFAVLLYIGWIGTRQKRLRQQVDDLHERLQGGLDLGERDSSGM